MIDPKLLDWATPTQAKYIEAVNLHGSGDNTWNGIPRVVARPDRRHKRDRRTD